MNPQKRKKPRPPGGTQAWSELEIDSNCEMRVGDIVHKHSMGKTARSGVSAYGHEAVSLTLTKVQAP